MHGLEKIIVVVLSMIDLETMFLITLYVNGVATHFFFHCIKYIDERQVFTDTVRDLQKY